MDLNSIFSHIVGPYGALFLLLVAVIFLWRQNTAKDTLIDRQGDLFEEALKVIRDDLLPLVRDTVRKR